MPQITYARGWYLRTIPENLKSKTLGELHIRISELLSFPGAYFGPSIVALSRLPSYVIDHLLECWLIMARLVEVAVKRRDGSSDLRKWWRGDALDPRFAPDE